MRRTVIFLSDLHLGRAGERSSREQEKQLLHFLRSVREEVEHLYLLGDVFEDFIEYHHVVPKGFTRFKGLLAEWSDAGIPITYLVGNHDPWHVDYFEHEVGVTIEFGDLFAAHQDRRLLLSHGDRIVSTSRANAWLRDWLRHPVPVWMYRQLLPADLGISLARIVSTRFGNRKIDWDLVEGLRVHARRILAESPVDTVVLGHSHFPELHQWPVGRYMNTGYWHESRTFGRLVDGELQLMQWNGRTAEIVER